MLHTPAGSRPSKLPFGGLGSNSGQICCGCSASVVLLVQSSGHIGVVPDHHTTQLHMAPGSKHIPQAKHPVQPAGDADTAECMPVGLGRTPLHQALHTSMTRWKIYCVSLTKYCSRHQSSSDSIVTNVVMAVDSRAL